MLLVLSDANYVPLSPISFLRRARRAFGDKVAVVDGDGTEVSYESLAMDGDALAAALRAGGIRPGERVAVLDLNTRWLLAAHFGVPGAGAVLVAMNTRLAPAEYRDILAHSRSRLLLLSPALVPALGVTSAADLPVEQVVMLPGPADADGAGGADGAGAGTALAGAEPYEQWLARGDHSVMELPATETDMIAVNYTSGTTGRPKGVVYTHRGAYLNAVSVALELELTATSWHLWTLPMFHCNGWSLTWGTTVVGATHVCLPTFDAQAALELINRYPVTHLCGAPVVLSELARAGSQRGFVADRPVRAVVGGAPPTQETIAAVQAMGVRVSHLYGLTETYGPSLVCEYQQGWAELPAARLAERLSRQGVPTVSVDDVRVVGKDLLPVAPDGSAVGEIVVRSNTVAAGYLDDEAATATAFRDGWFHTGDLGVLHPDGYVELTDRSKDVIISGGENIASVEVEKVLAAHPAVLEAAVVATPDERWGERPVAFVTTGAAVTERELIDFVRARIAHFKAPDRVYFRDLPKTSTGKIQKHVLRGLANADRPDGTSGADRADRADVTAADG
jgi:fatty-acyl-CoA synthase